MQLVKDHQGLPPGVAGSVAISAVVVDIPEANERAGRVIAVAYGLFQLKGPLVGGNGLGILAEAMMSVADTIQREGLAFALTGLPGQIESLAAIDQGLFVPSELSLEPADIVQ